MQYRSSPEDLQRLAVMLTNLVTKHEMNAAHTVINFFTDSQQIVSDLINFVGNEALFCVTSTHLLIVGNRTITITKDLLYVGLKY